MYEDMTKGLCRLQLNSINSVDDDPSLLKLSFSILDFDVSGNRQIVNETLALEAAPTLQLKPLMAHYTPTTNYENKNDHFNGHGEYVSKDRDGNDTIQSQAIAIGVAKEGGYLTTIKNENNEDTSVLACDFYLWQFRYPDICSLIVEMYENGIPLYSSCEYYFFNYHVNNGVQYIDSPLLFDGHCVLKSNENEQGFTAPAYDSSKLLSINERWNKAVSQAILDKKSENELDDINKNKIENQKEEDGLEKENLFYKMICELSHGDIRTKLYEALSKIMPADEYWSVWISQYNVYDTYFVFETYEGNTYIYYKVNYSKTETDVTIDYTTKAEVKWSELWVEATSAKQMEISLNEINKELISANEMIESLNAEKEGMQSELSTANETISSLNAKVEEFAPIVEQHNEEKIEKVLNEKKEYYSVKFKAVNAIDKFESEEVQELIKKSVNDTDEGRDAILSLSTMLVDLMEVKSNNSKETESKEKEIVEFSSKNEKLIEVKTDFDSRYSK